MIKRTLIINAVFFGLLVHAPAADKMKPQMVQTDALVLNEDFNKPRELEKENWSQRQHTRWAIKDGVLLGIPSSEEFQATAKDHQGFEPRLSIPSCPDEYAIQFSLRITGGKETAICPFIEFGHHKARLRWSEKGAQLMVDHESIQLALDPSFKLESGTWYHALAEVKGDELLIRFTNGSVLYGKHPAIAGEKDGFGVAGNQGGKVELDNLKVWSVKDAPNAKWKAFLKTIKSSEHKILKPEVVKGA